MLMRSKIRSLVVVLLAIYVCHAEVHAQTAASAKPADSSAEQTGQKIGTIVKTAISTAVPAVGSILDLIWAKTGKSNDDKVKKTELKTAAADDATSKQIQQQFAAMAQAKIAPVKHVADEIGIINSFLEPTVLASQHVIVMQTALKNSSPDWNLITIKWGLAKTQIGKTKAVTDAQINQISDIYLRDKLKQIRDTNDSNVQVIESEIAQKNISDLKGDLGLLSTTLGNMAAIAGYEFADLQGDINFLANWAKGTGAGGEDKPTDQSQIFKTVLDTNLPKQNNGAK
jgi:hypothetical protein